MTTLKNIIAVLLAAILGGVIITAGYHVAANDDNVIAEVHTLDERAGGTVLTQRVTLKSGHWYDVHTLHQNRRMPGTTDYDHHQCGLSGSCILGVAALLTLMLALMGTLVWGYARTVTMVDEWGM